MEKKEIRIVKLLNNGALPFKVVGTIYEESDYSKFSTFMTNRTPDHVGRIKANILEHGYVTNPILVTLNPINYSLIVIDGWNRFNALKELGLPIQFTILDGATEQDMITLNLIMKQWKPINFARFYAARGNQNYITMLSFLDEYKDFGIQTMEYVLKLSSTQDHGHGEKNGHKFDRGFFKVVDANRSREILDFCMKVKQIPVRKKRDSVYNQQRFVTTIMRLFRDCDCFEPEEVLNAMDLERAMICRKTTGEEYAKMLEEMVNNHITKKDNKRHYDIF